ncbi:hypothetical protein FRC01_008954, partial [Tulasnella sp. 417]
MRGLLRKTALDEFLWELCLSEGTHGYGDVIRKHHDLRTFWPMTESIINNLREVGECFIPEGGPVYLELEGILYRGLKRVLAASPQDTPSIIAWVTLLAIHTTAFGLVDESSLTQQISSKMIISAFDVLPTLANWLREDSIVEPMLTLRAAFIATLGSVTQKESSSGGTLLEYEPHTLQIPYHVLFRTDYPFANEYEEIILLQCASIIMRPPSVEAQTLRNPAGLAVEKYGGLGVAQGIRKVLSSRSPLHAIVGERILRHFYDSPGGRALPWLEAGVHIGIMDNLWKARRLELHSSERVESDFPRVAYKGLLTIGLMMGGASASYEHGM